MRTWEFGLAAVGRFMAVEIYYQSQQPASAHPLQGSGGDRTSGHARKQGRRSGGEVPDGPEHG
jgi:hypothetical protein